MVRRATTRTMPLLNSDAYQMRADASGEEKRLKGYAAVFGAIYELWPGATESIDPHAFDEALNDDVRCLIDHETRLVLGRNKSGSCQLGIDGHGLWFDNLINDQDSDATNLYARVMRGDVSGCSFGFDILEEETEHRPDGSVHWTIKKVKLYEISICTFPAYEATSVEARRQDFETIRRREVEDWKTKTKERMSKWH